MSEHFEQQVKRILDDVQFEPQEKVWQNLKQSITTGKRRRRFVFWWMLPVVLSAALFIYYMQNGREEGSPVAEHNTVLIENKSGNNGNRNNIVVVEEMRSGNAPVSSVIEQEKPVNSPSFIAAGEKKSTDLHNDILHDTEAEGAFNLKPEEKPEMNADAGENISEAAILTGDGVDEDQSGETRLTKSQTKAEKKKEIPATDSTSAESVNKTGVNSKASKWSFGLTAEAGSTSVVEGLFSGTETSTITPSFSSPTGPLAGSLSNNVYQHTTSGSRPAFGLALTAQRELNSRFSFRSSLGYKFQTYSMLTSARKDSSILGSISSYPVASVSSQYKFHFLNLYTGLSFKFLKSEDMNLGLAAGIDNKWLIGADRVMKYWSGMQALAETKSNSLEKHNQWQPHLSLQLMADIGSKNKRWLQLSPYLRYGLRSFEKQPSTSRDRLMSFGVMATYFLR